MPYSSVESALGQQLASLLDLDVVLRDRLIAALDAHELVVITDQEGVVRYASSGFLDTVGYRAEELIGQHFKIFEVRPQLEEDFKEIIASLERGDTWKGEVCLRSAQGMMLWVKSTLVPFGPEGGNPICYLALLNDISGMRRLKDAAEKANLAKSEFLSSMSHELRTPMNAIIGFAQVLQYDDTLDIDQQDSVHEIIRAGEHLLKLINEVLDLTKIESGHIDLEIEEVDLNDVLVECKELLSPVAIRQGVTMSFDDIRVPALYADHTRLKQILLNLLSNGIKYNRRNGIVNVSAEVLENKRVRICVQDTGPGIELAKQNLLFEPFQRLGQELGEIEGTGVGLSICRTLVKLMNGSIGLTSEKNQGCCFWIELPVSDGTLDMSGKKAERVDRAYSGVQKISHQVLYIEDNPANMRLVKQILTKRPHVQLLMAHEPTLGLELAATHKPDLILLDINMPQMNGYEVLQRLRETPELADILVVALTASAMPQDIEKGKKAGFDGYLTKPVNIAELLNQVDSL